MNAVVLWRRRRCAPDGSATTGFSGTTGRGGGGATARLSIAATGLLLVFGAPAMAQAAAAAVAGGPAIVGAKAARDPVLGTWGFDLTGMDLSVRPGDDFFRYANGNWLARTAIPPERSTVGLFRDLDYAADAAVRDIVEGLGTRLPPSGSSAGHVAAMYRAFMDEAAVEARGASPLVAELGRLRGIHTRKAMAEVMGRSFGRLGASLFGIDIAYDAHDPARYAVHIGQAGLGLPDRDYYLEPEFAAQISAYRKYAAMLLELAGWRIGAAAGADADADAVIAFETRVAQASWSHERVRDATRTYNPSSVDALAASIPDFPWRTFLAAAGLDAVPRVVLTTNTSLPELARIFATTPLETIKAWEAFRLADAAAPYLSRPFDAANFEFRRRTLGGQQVPAPRWQRGVDLLNGTLGSAVGELYVARHYPPEAGDEARRLAENVRAALRLRIRALAWMSEATKAEALRKLDRQEVQTGRPARWIDYSPLLLNPSDLLGDVVAWKAFDWKRRIAESTGPWNKSDWRFWPQTATSYSENGQLIITAAMLQAPFFDAAADAAVNYGGIGAVIGHELTHQFDDQGRHEDADGRLRDWWSPDDARHFEEQARKLSAQYSAIEILPGLHVKGDVTLGENLADLGGLTVALTAYRLSLAGKTSPVLDGFTGDQRVFLGWVQSWREKRREDSLRQQVTSDLHSPATARVDGPVRNIDDWYAAFDARPGQSLYLAPAARVTVW